MRVAESNKPDSGRDCQNRLCITQSWLTKWKSDLDYNGSSIAPEPTQNIASFHTPCAQLSKMDSPPVDY